MIRVNLCINEGPGLQNHISTPCYFMMLLVYYQRISQLNTAPRSGWPQGRMVGGVGWMVCRGEGVGPGGGGFVRFLGVTTKAIGGVGIY